MVAVQFGLQQGLAVCGRQRLATVLHGNAQAWHLTTLIQGHHQQDLALVGVFSAFSSKLDNAWRSAWGHR